MAQMFGRITTFNEDQFRLQTNTDTFSLFPLLSVELRLHIWDLAIQERRILYLHIDRFPADADERVSPYNSKNQLGNKISGGHYRWGLHGSRRFSPLFHTCSESRKAALNHYRICLPAVSPDASLKKIYLSPEYDILMLDIWEDSAPLLIDFLNDLRAYDPKGVGILQLGMDDSAFLKLNNLAIDDFSLAARELFKTILENLRCIWAVTLFQTSSRLMLGFLDGTGLNKTTYNPSPPIFCYSQAFERLKVDPRPIAHYLGRTAVWTNPKSLKTAWQNLERLFLDDKQNKALLRAFSYVFTVKPEMGDPCVANTEMLNTYVQNEIDQWQTWAQKTHADDTIEPGGEMVPLTAAGMWILPEETFDTLEVREYPDKAMVDLSGCQPGLILSDLRFCNGMQKGSAERDLFWRDDHDIVYREDFEY